MRAFAAAWLDISNRGQLEGGDQVWLYDVWGKRASYKDFAMVLDVNATIVQNGFLTSLSHATDFLDTVFAGAEVLGDENGRLVAKGSQEYEAAIAWFKGLEKERHWLIVEDGHTRLRNIESLSYPSVLHLNGKQGFDHMRRIAKALLGDTWTADLLLPARVWGQRALFQDQCQQALRDTMAVESLTLPYP